jgi:3-oxoacyl-[acyl-carrier protein] reductase
MRKALEKIPLRREATSEDVANMVSFLLSPQASYVTGAFVPVSGGFQ